MYRILACTISALMENVRRENISGDESSISFSYNRTNETQTLETSSTPSYFLTLTFARTQAVLNSNKLVIPSTNGIHSSDLTAFDNVQPVITSLSFELIILH